MPDYKIGRNSTLGERVRIRGDVEIGDNCVIEPDVVLEGRIRIHDGVSISHHSTLWGNVTIRQDCLVYPYVMIGTVGQDGPLPSRDPLDSSKLGLIVIGEDSVIHEFTSIKLPVKGSTLVGRQCWIMARSHLGHNVELGNNVKVGVQSILAGFVKVGDNTFIGINSIVHQRRMIGMHAVTGMGSVIVKDVPPFALINDGRFTRINETGLTRAGVGSAEISDIETLYRSSRFNDTWYGREIRRFTEESKQMYRPEFTDLL